MNERDFSLCVTNQLEECKRVLGLKGEAYAGHSDRLANFKRNAERLGLSKYQIWGVYANKHIDAVNNAIKANASKPKDKSEGLDGRITDVINYMLLLKAMLQDDAPQI